MGDKHGWYAVLLMNIWISSVHCGVHPDGISDIYRSQDALGNYQFGYTVAGGDGEQFRREGTDPQGAVIGSYGLTDADGRHRVVDYVADENGFRAHVRTNEPGTTNSNPSGVIIEKDNSNEQLGHLDSAATSLTSSSKRAPPGISDHVAYGTRLTSVSSANPSHSNPVDHSSVRVPSDSPIVRQSPIDNAAGSISYYPPIRALSPLNPSLHEERASEYDPQGDLEYQQPQRRPYSIDAPQLDIQPRPYTPPYGGSYEYPNIYREPYPQNEGNRYPQALVPTLQDGNRNPIYLNVPTSHLDRDAQTPGRIPSEGFPGTSRGYPAVSTINGISIPIPNSENPNLVLRAVSIPNGIQAVQVDTSTGEVFRNFEFPVYRRQSVSSENPFDVNINRPGYFQNNDFGNYAPNIQRDYDSNTYQRNSDFPIFINSQRPFIGYPNRNPSSLSGTQRRVPQTHNFPSQQPNFSTTTERDIATMSRYFPPYDYGSQRNADESNIVQNERLNGRQQDYLLGPRYPLFYNPVDLDHPRFYDNYGPSSSKSRAVNPYLPPEMNLRPYYQYPKFGELRQDRGRELKSTSKQNSALKFETTTKDP